MPLSPTCAAALLTATIWVSNATAARAADCPGALDQPTSATTAAAANAVACLVNQERASRGLRPLTRDPALGLSARHHASDMAERDFFSHVTPAGATFGDRLRAAGYGAGRGWRAGEALGWGSGTRATPDALVAEWLASAPHRRIVLDAGFRELGIGVAAGTPRPGAGDGATYVLDLGVVR